MNKILFYVFATILYLTLSKALAPDNISLEYIKTSKDLKKFIKLSPATAILEKTMKKGYLIKTYYQRYKIVYAYRPPKLIIVRTKRTLAEKTSKYIGMSLFRIDEDNKISTVPMPPGYLFIGNKKYGRWLYKDKIAYWKFYQSYKKLPQYFGWGSFTPDKKFLVEAKSYEKDNTPFLGLSNEFGHKGSVTNKFLPEDTKKSGFRRVKFRNLFRNYRKMNYN